MYDLRVTVDEIKGFCDLPMKLGDYFEVKGGRIMIPQGKHICLWALQSIMPMLPLKQRKTNEENDWVPHTHRMCCPDPNGMVIYRIDILENGALVDIEDPLKKRMLVDATKCTGCRACETVCSFSHTGSFCGEQSRIKVYKDEANGEDVPHICRQCGTATCVMACPVDALSRDPLTKAIILAEATCIACGKCKEACPFDSIAFHQDTHKPLICDLCKGEPACVKRCAVDAIVYGHASQDKI